MHDMDRRTFLRNTVGAVGSLTVAPSGLSSLSGLGTDSHLLPATARPTLRLAGGDFGFPSPFAYVANPGYWRMSLIYDTLLWEDSTGGLLPWLAKRYDVSSHGLTHTFHLRADARWHDGKPVTAEDVVFTFRYFAMHVIPPVVVARPPLDVVHVQAISRYTVRIHLARPMATFARSVAALLPIVPKHIWSSVHDPAREHNQKVLIGSGPYRLDSYSSAQGSYLYTANDRYFLGRPFVKRIELRPVGDPLNALLVGDIDGGETGILGVGPDALAPFRADHSFGVIEQRGAFTFPLFWNLGKGGALADVRFRRACAMAIDRPGIVRRLLKGNGLPGNPGFLPPTNPFYVHVDQYPFNGRAANRLLDDAGYKTRGSNGIRHGHDGRPLSFSLLTGNTPVPPVLDLVVNDLKSIGVKITPQVVDLITLFGRTTHGFDEMAMTLYPGPSGPGLNADADYLRQIYSSQAPRTFNHVEGYANHEMDQLAQRQLATLDTPARRQLLGRMQHIAARDLPVLPLYYSTLFFIFKKSVFNQWYYTPLGGPSGVYNKQVFVTGRKRGLAIRPVD